jgi:hypothetical protein
LGTFLSVDIKNLAVCRGLPPKQFKDVEICVLPTKTDRKIILFQLMIPIRGVVQLLFVILMLNCVNAWRHKIYLKDPRSVHLNKPNSIFPYLEGSTIYSNSGFFFFSFIIYIRINREKTSRKKIRTFRIGETFLF